MVGTPSTATTFAQVDPVYVVSPHSVDQAEPETSAATVTVDDASIVAFVG